eukprot:jgi/Picre1/30325/NNA_005689.t1
MEEIDENDAWAVISSYFEDKGLVRQQLDSFNEFINTSLQEIVDENSTITVIPQNQHQPGQDMDEDEEREVQLKFGQIFLSKPIFVEPDGETVVLFPKEARLRNLTYSAPLALGLVSDRDILQHIVYDFNDTAMLDALRPSIEEAIPIQSQEVALDFIGKRGSVVGATKDKRIAYARDLLQKELLPHLGSGPASETKKAYFFGYVIHRLLLVALGRREEDDRDHYANRGLTSVDLSWLVFSEDSTEN